jgi:hypothetical protein
MSPQVIHCLDKEKEYGDFPDNKTATKPGNFVGTSLTEDEAAYVSLLQLRDEPFISSD